MESGTSFFKWEAAKSAEAKFFGRGGVQAVADITGMSRQTIYVGISDIDLKNHEDERIRKAGGGRKSLVNKHPKLLAIFDQLIEPSTRGDPESPLRWTCKSARNLAENLSLWYW